jgi:hypothetical protein
LRHLAATILSSRHTEEVRDFNPFLSDAAVRGLKAGTVEMLLRFTWAQAAREVRREAMTMLQYLQAAQVWSSPLLTHSFCM